MKNPGLIGQALLNFTKNGEYAVVANAENTDGFAVPIQTTITVAGEVSKPDSKLTGDVIRAIVVLSQMNAHIWYNESQVRKGEKGSDNLMLTHGLNGIRNTAINKIMEVVGGRKDYKVDCIASEFKDWDVSW